MAVWGAQPRREDWSFARLQHPLAPRLRPPVATPGARRETGARTDCFRRSPWRRRHDRRCRRLKAIVSQCSWTARAAQFSDERRKVLQSSTNWRHLCRGTSLGGLLGSRQAATRRIVLGWPRVIPRNLPEAGGKAKEGAFDVQIAGWPYRRHHRSK
jgi:hypothetical protein